MLQSCLSVAQNLRLSNVKDIGADQVQPDIANAVASPGNKLMVSIAYFIATISSNPIIAIAFTNKSWNAPSAAQ